jgi:hypothetical protein
MPKRRFGARSCPERRREASSAPRWTTSLVLDYSYAGSAYVAQLPLWTVYCRHRRIGRSLATLAGKDVTQGIHAVIALSAYRPPRTRVNRNFFTKLPQASLQLIRKLGFREGSGEPFSLKHVRVSSESGGPRGSTKATKPQGRVIGFPTVLDHHPQGSEPVLRFVLHSAWGRSEDGQKRTGAFRIETNRHFQSLPSRDRQGHPWKLIATNLKQQPRQLKPLPFITSGRHLGSRKPINHVPYGRGCHPPIKRLRPLPVSPRPCPLAGRCDLVSPCPLPCGKPDRCMRSL